MNRVLLKISGETLGERGFSSQKADILISEIIHAKKEKNFQLALVVGGGNTWSGRESSVFGFFPADSDAIGMMATFLNAMVLKNTLQKMNMPARIFSSRLIDGVSEIHNPSREIDSLESGEIVIFAGGTGAPFFTTDSAAVLRGLEIRADAVLKGTKVNGVYDSNPEHNPNATRFSSLSFTEALEKDLRIMDATAFALARENNLPIYVFDMFEKNSLIHAISGKGEGTWIKN